MNPLTREMKGHVWEVLGRTCPGWGIVRRVMGVLLSLKAPQCPFNPLLTTCHRRKEPYIEGHLQDV